MNYNLSDIKTGKAEIKFFWRFLRDEKRWMVLAFIGLVISSGLNLLTPVLIGKAIDVYIIPGNISGLWRIGILLGVIYMGAFIVAYIQTLSMGGVGQRLLYKLRNTIFKKIESLPVAFFNQNKAGDLISRINNDTEKLNTFFSQSIMQFVGNGFMMIGAGVFLLSLNLKLGIACLIPAFVILIITRALTGFIKKANTQSLQTTGMLSASIQEGLDNFKVVVAFNRRDYFKASLQTSNDENYRAAFKTGIANNMFTPLYTFTGAIAGLVAVVYGIFLIEQGDITLGLLVSFLTYVTRFYDPIRQIASFWASLQSALAAGDRVKVLLDQESHMKRVKHNVKANHYAVLEMNNVTFGYTEGRDVLRNINLVFETGKTYALVGPTGGGKTTTASLVARLYDPKQGTILLSGKDIRSYKERERTQKIGFILQDPFLFSGTVKENILYANTALQDMEDTDLEVLLQEKGLTDLMERFEKGIHTIIDKRNGGLSSGQQQIIAFARAILREPDLLILDEATANIDTVTEQLLQKALDALPENTTRVVIAHRLNTIENADEIFFVNGGYVTRAGSLDQAINMLLHKEKTS